MLRKILAVLGVVGCVAIAYAVNYPVTSIRDTDGHQLGINADGSLNATVDPTISSSMTINNDLAVTGSIFVPKVKGNGSTLILDPKATLLNAATFYSNGDVSIQNQIQAKYGIFTGTTTFVGKLTCVDRVKAANFSADTISNTSDNQNYISYNGVSPMNINPDGIAAIRINEKAVCSTWTVSGLTMAPGASVNTSSASFTANYSVSFATGSMLNTTATPTLGAYTPSASTVPTTWIKIMIIDANGTKIPAYIPVWQ